MLDNINHFDLVFLDIELSNENGITIGKEIRKINSDIRIIIYSSYSKYLIEGYKIQADRYFLKPISQEDFNIEFENVIYRYLKEYEGFYDKKICERKIYFKEILYIEFIDRKTQIHLLNSKKIITPYPLKYWEEKCIQQSFSKPHKSFLINLRHISGFSNHNIILINTESLPLSKHFKKSFNEAYVNYLQVGL